MKKIYKTFLLVFFISFTSKDFAQSKEPDKLFRIYEDDDRSRFNFVATNFTRKYFHMKRHSDIKTRNTTILHENSSLKLCSINRE